MSKNSFLEDIESYVFNLYKAQLPTEVVYHNFEHTVRVVNAAKAIGDAEKISEDEMEVLTIAAWFHDTGFIKGEVDHEEYSATVAHNYLTKKNYGADKIEVVTSLIACTKMPQTPTNHLEEIMCDADLSHIGSPDFMDLSAMLRMEWEHIKGGKQLSDLEWLEENERFVGKHKFFTNYGFVNYGPQKNKNWQKLQKSLKKEGIKLKEQKQKAKAKKADLERKERKNKTPERGIETMYRVTLRNHLKLSDIADTKANILLSVSSIILSITLTVLFPKLDKADNAYLVYPTIVFVIVAVITMVYCVLSTRPKVTKTSFTDDDVKNRKVNLLFFGNFYKMNLEDFQNGMLEVMEDRDYLYKSLMKDLYFLGIVLEKKYRLLRIAYNIFMVGIIISVFTFILSFRIMKMQGGIN